MHVAGGDHRLVEFFTQFDDRPVELPQGLFIWYVAIAHHEHVVSQRLNLQIIVEACNFAQRIPRLPVENRPVQLSRFAGAPNQQPFAVLRQHALWNARLLEEIIQMREGDQFIQVLQTGLVLDQNNLMIGAHLLWVAPRQ